MANYAGKIGSVTPIYGAVTPQFSQYIDFSGKVQTVTPIYGTDTRQLNAFVDFSGKLGTVTPLQSKPTILLYGSITSSTSLSGEIILLDLITIEGGIAIQSSLTGEVYIFTVVPVEGDISIQSSLSGDIGILYGLYGSIEATASLSGTLWRPLWTGMRYGDYDPDLIWDEDAGEWITADGSAGSRLQTNLVAIGSNDTGQGVIYYG